MKLKSFLTVSLLLSGCALGRGARPPRDIKIYRSQPDDSWCNEAWCQGMYGLVRSQDREVKPYSESKDYFAVSPEDFKKLLERCPQP